MDIREAITNIRLAYKVSNIEFSRMLDVSSSTVYNYLAGIRSPRADVIRKLDELAKLIKVEFNAKDYL